MALPVSGPISFADFNTELSNSAGTQVDLQTVGETFNLDTDATNWSDSVAGLGMNEFYGLDIDDVYGGGGESPN